jgi:hypothetical protein
LENGAENEEDCDFGRKMCVHVRGDGDAQPPHVRGDGDAQPPPSPTLPQIIIVSSIPFFPTLTSP